MNFVRMSYCHRQQYNFGLTGSTLLTLRPAIRHVRECAARAPGNNILEAQSSRAAFEIWVHLVRVPLGARSSNLNLVHLSKYSLILCSKIAFWKMSPLCQTPSSNSHQVPTYLTFIKFTLKHFHQVHCACEIWAHFIQGLHFFELKPWLCWVLI